MQFVKNRRVGYRSRFFESQFEGSHPQVTQVIRLRENEARRRQRPIQWDPRQSRRYKLRVRYKDWHGRLDINEVSVFIGGLWRPVFLNTPKQQKVGTVRRGTNKPLYDHYLTEEAVSRLQVLLS